VGSNGQETELVMDAGIPLATYRLQLTKNFGFDDAAALVPYLKELGVSHLYASPFLKARPGSTHGYDIVDHDQLNPELGGEAGFARLSAELHKHDLALILDFVPNHMGVGHADNAWWLDVLEWGEESPHAASFDIDWNALPYRRHSGVLLPILGRPYGDALQSGEIELKFEPAGATFAAWYFDQKLPINPQRYDEILRTVVHSAGADSEPAGRELLALADEYGGPRAPSYRDAPALKRALAGIEDAAAVINRGLAAYRNDAGAALLHRLLERQHYRLAYWRVAFSAVNYRRFFDITDLAGVRVEHPATFRAMHALIARLIAADQLQGLRLDHIDGLRDPAQYTRRLSQLARKTRREAALPARFYIIVEKILAEGETMPHLPGVAGTTGYEWLNVLSHVLVDGRGLAPLDSTWRDFSGERRDFPAMLEDAKRRVVATILASEFGVLCQALSRIAAGHFSTRDFTIDRLRAALLLYVLEFPVYRTYVTAAGAAEADRKLISAVIARGRARWSGPDPQIFDFLQAAMTLDLAASAGYSAPRLRDFALKLQQFTGPLMAKAMEDTAFYRYHRLLAFNEVGGNPVADELSVSEFHQMQRQRAIVSPGGLTATATHDTKRGEDARARILALSELAGEWDTAVRDWRECNARLVQVAGGRSAPTAPHEYMLYQALIGAWPGRTDGSFVKRMQDYAVKAAREGKEETNWTDPNETYEAALRAFVENLLDPAISGGFLASFETLAARTALLGALNSLSQLALKATLPAPPDFYQGSELWDLSLVDPDNRHPVDFAARKNLLSKTQACLPADRASWSALAASWQDGAIKLRLMGDLLRLRRQWPNVFRCGSYETIETIGPHRSHVIAFARIWKKSCILVSVGRHFGQLTNAGRDWPSGWEATLAVPSGKFREILFPTPACYENKIAVSDLFRHIPISVLARA
jgi:(1->4)-alpha-D-glucan 1-alpha-D-glucosylmutase